MNSGAPGSIIYYNSSPVYKHKVWHFVLYPTGLKPIVVHTTDKVWLTKEHKIKLLSLGSNIGTRVMFNSIIIKPFIYVLKEEASIDFGVIYKKDEVLCKHVLAFLFSQDYIQGRAKWKRYRLRQPKTLGKLCLK